MVGWNRSNALNEIIAAAGVGCEKLEQVGSLFWSMAKRGKKGRQKKELYLRNNRICRVESKRIIHRK